ncbi:tyrosine-protein kinase receptor torso-like [Agrilus planipennis]|uniref:receptor protein-tyrosine kinase n=1 Tax=Agrilus planipennis TaxID=224129 RepID=A0A7F5RDL4_AGRPL|nr:tyrosine-protein kinase receptor torso-like [Agrilus planipennis]
MNVSGDETSAVFSNVKFRSCYVVEITAFSNGGNSTSSNDVEISSPVITPVWKVGDFLVIFGVVTVSFAVVLVSFIVYRYFKFAKVKRQRLEATADFYEHRKSASGVYTIAQIEQPIIEYSDKWELDADNLTIGQVIGEGAFGIVRKGYLHINSESIPVAIKMLKDYPNSSDLKEFQQEIEIMKTVGSHPHLVSLIGMCSWKRRNRPLLIVEFCAKGDLQSYLRSVWRKLNGHCMKIEDYKSLQYANNGEVSNKLYDMQDDLNGYILKPLDLLSFARQIALGMEYLSSLRLLHRDLAARNVLVCEDNCVKVADFGLSRDVYQDNIYCKSSGGKLPLKWMAIESLTHQQYTTQSDVWSYGILLWEIVTLGGFPYPDVATRDLLKYLESGCRMARPENCSMELYKLMRSCWEYNPYERPTFTEIVKYLNTLLENEIEYIKLGS